MRDPHGSNVPATAGIRDPFGRPFVGSVDDFISNFAGSHDLPGPLQSPTFNVSASHLTAALADLRARGAAQLIRNRRRYSWTNEFTIIFTRLAINHHALNGGRPGLVPGNRPRPAICLRPVPWQSSEQLYTDARQRDRRRSAAIARRAYPNEHAHSVKKTGRSGCSRSRRSGRADSAASAVFRTHSTSVRAALCVPPLWYVSALGVGLFHHNIVLSRSRAGRSHLWG